MSKPPRDERKPPPPPPPDPDAQFDLAAGIELQQIDHPLIDLLAPPKKKPMHPGWKMFAVGVWLAVMALLCMTVASVIEETTVFYSCRYCDLTYTEQRVTIFGMAVSTHVTATWPTERTFAYGQYVGIPHQHRFYSRGGSTLSNSILRVGEVRIIQPDPEAKLCDYALRVSALLSDEPEDFVREVYLEMMRGDANATLPGVAWILRTNPDSQQRSTAAEVWRTWLANRKAYRLERERKEPPGSNPDTIPESVTTTTVPQAK